MLAAAAVYVTAAAQPPADPMEVCSQKVDAGARLACFDQEMQRRHSSAAQTVTAAKSAEKKPDIKKPDIRRADEDQPGENQPDENQPDENFGLEGDPLRHKLRDQGVVKPPPPRPMSAQVVQAKSSPDHRFTFTLNNGQVWEQTETRASFYLAPNEPVTISAGTLGSYFLATPKKEYVRVRRLQ